MQEFTNIALAGVAQLAGCHPETQKVTGLIPDQGICLDFGLVPGYGVGEATDQCISHTLMFLFLSFSPTSPLSKNNLIKSFLEVYKYCSPDFDI